MNCYLVQGDDQFEKEHYINDIKSQYGNLKKGMNLILIDKDNLNTLEQELTTYSFLKEEKLIIVKIPKKSKDEEAPSDWLSDRVLELLSEKVENATVIFVEDGSGKGKLYNAINKYGKVIKFEKDKKDKLNSWVMEECKNRNIVISPQSISYFIEICGTDKQILSQEINKLMDYIGTKGVIDKGVIDLLCIKAPEVIIFDLTDALGRKNTKLALKYLSELLECKEPLQKIMIMITKHFKMLLLSKIAIKEGKNLARDLGVNAYAAKKYSEQARNFSEEELLKTFEDLAKLDIDSKLGKMDLKIGIEKIFMQM